MRVREFIPFPKGINLNVNVIARLEFELAYNDVAVEHVNHNTSGDSKFLIFHK